MALRGWTTLAWQADYGQFYLVDREDEAFHAPEHIDEAMLTRSFAALPSGLVVYTEGCLQQHIRINIHDGEPDHPDEEWLSGKPWTRVRTTEVRFPSRQFSLSSPSSPDPLPNGPFFLLDTVSSHLRISWMEFEGSRDDSVPVQPDVIELTFWPAEG